MDVAEVPEQPKTRIEYAKTARSTCSLKNPKRADAKRFACPACEPTNPKKPNQEGKVISQGAIRVGVWNDNYSNWYVWKHLCCWRVPQAVYDALPEDLSDKAAVLFAVKGMKDRILSIDDTLTDDDYAAVADWVADKANYSNHDSDGNNWKLKPKKAAKKKKALAADEAEAAEKAVLTEVPVAAAAQRPKKKAKKESAPTSNVGRPAKNENARPYTTDNLPVAGQDGAAAPDCLAGLKVVVTGFSKKDKGAAEDLVLAFGGKKMSSVSKNTGLVLCGLTPGQGKLDKAESLGVRKCDFCDFCDMLRDGTIAQLLG